ncbi:MAG: L,D-transpeptidase family protein [bacterium]
MKSSFGLGVGIFLLCFLILPRTLNAVATTDQNIDTDKDGLTDLDETVKYYTSPQLTDTDGDGKSDGEEIKNGDSPRFKGKKLSEVDSDKDGLNDSWELILGTSLANADTDGDTFKDGLEVNSGFDPTNKNPVKVEKSIRVSDKELRLRYYFGDKELAVLPVSTGKKSTPTPHGDFKVIAKVPVKYYKGPTWDYPNTKWNLFFTTERGYRFYIHSAYWHNKFGKSPVSGGCVNVRVADMGALYDFAQVGTKVYIQ